LVQTTPPSSAGSSPPSAVLTEIRGTLRARPLHSSGAAVALRPGLK